LTRVSQTQLTPSAHARLKAELEDLTTRGRTEVAQEIEIARAHGDLSENGDYHAAKEKQGLMEARIRKIESMLRDAVIAEDDGSGAVQAGSIVTIVYEGDSPDDAERYLVGSIEERVEGLDVISPASPLGEALIGTVQGDTVAYQAPTGATLRVTVVAVER
jgi:transcription elongation factor GreA